VILFRTESVVYIPSDVALPLLFFFSKKVNYTKFNRLECVRWRKWKGNWDDESLVFFNAENEISKIPSHDLCDV